ncbi:nuclear transport factor 2 family protein [Cryptosporangium aurantiacum]|uniref:Ketosteroid isomerase-related protein n=1 Tax=Cryptosporangium aurantiacum TaxID=134849 RepID=A0A1M7NG37_9ACTN|nr:nuclear transport factor 2 family protein [Cryptosporangium aurantiacum]SHN02655.1 Ketosteroid isomerase-related protein [Cryptosporangium aurantiacum]
MSNAEIVRATVAAYQAQDRAAIEALLAEDYVFTSPQDDHIDRAAYLERCFPTADRFVEQRIVHLVEVGADEVFLLYEYELVGGGRYRNAEVATVRDGRLTETQVFFGGRVPE